MAMGVEESNLLSLGLPNAAELMGFFHFIPLATPLPPARLWFVYVFWC